MVVRTFLLGSLAGLACYLFLRFTSSFRKYGLINMLIAPPQLGLDTQKQIAQFWLPLATGFIISLLEVRLGPGWVWPWAGPIVAVGASGLYVLQVLKHPAQPFDSMGRTAAMVYAQFVAWNLSASALGAYLALKTRSLTAESIAGDLATGLGLAFITWFFATQGTASSAVVTQLVLESTKDRATDIGSIVRTEVAATIKETINSINKHNHEETAQGLEAQSKEIAEMLDQFLAERYPGNEAQSHHFGYPDSRYRYPHVTAGASVLGVPTYGIGGDGEDIERPRPHGYLPPGTYAQSVFRSSKSSKQIGWKNWWDQLLERAYSYYRT